MAAEIEDNIEDAWLAGWKQGVKVSAQKAEIMLIVFRNGCRLRKEKVRLQFMKLRKWLENQEKIQVLLDAWNQNLHDSKRSSCQDEGDSKIVQFC